MGRVSKVYRGKHLLDSDMKKEIFEKIKKYIEDSKAYYRDINLSSLIISTVYMKMMFGGKNFFRKSGKYILRCFVGFFYSSDIIKEECLFVSLQDIKYLFVFEWDLKAYHVFSIHDKVISNIKKKSDILIVTLRKSVYNYYISQGVSSIFLKIPFFLSPHGNRKKILGHFSVTEKNQVLDAVYLLDFAYNLMEKVRNLKALLTVDDVCYFDQIFTQAAKAFSVRTITHYHGIQPTPYCISKFVFSDKIVLWGMAGTEYYKEVLKESQMLVFGTDKFNYLLSSDFRNEKRIYLTVAFNSADTLDYMFWLSKKVWNLLILGSSKLQLALKAHPGSNVKIETLEKKLNDNEIRPVIFRENKNDELLWKTKFLIASRSNISFEAFLCGVSVIELIKKIYGAPSDLFKKIPESVISQNDLKSEILNRLSDNEYNSSIIKKQEEEIKFQIKYFDSSRREAEYLESL